MMSSLFVRPLMDLLMTIRFNFERQHFLQVPALLEKAFSSLPNVEIITEGVADLAINSMPWLNPISGKKTVYWELDIAEINHAGDYGFFDIVYLPSNMRKELWTNNCKFLPMAVDFDYYHPIKKEPKHDVIFMGRMDRLFREDYLNNLTSVGFDVLNTSAERGLKTTEVLSEAKCSFQVSHYNNLEQRNFEYSAVVPMVLETVPDIDSVFTETEHYRGFKRGDYKDFERQIRWCVENQDEALAMRDRMVKHLKENHTYIHRAKEILADLGLK